MFTTSHSIPYWLYRTFYRSNSVTSLHQEATQYIKIKSWLAWLSAKFINERMYTMQNLTWWLVSYLTTADLCSLFISMMNAVNYTTTADICYFVVYYLLIMFAVSFKIMSHVIACYIDATMLTFIWQVVGGMASCSCDEMYTYVCDTRHKKLYL